MTKGILAESRTVRNKSNATRFAFKRVRPSKGRRACEEGDFRSAKKKKPKQNPAKGGGGNESWCLQPICVGNLKKKILTNSFAWPASQGKRLGSGERGERQGVIKGVNRRKGNKGR